MSKQIFTATLLALSTSLIGCGDLGFDFDFTHDSPEYLIVGEDESVKSDDPMGESERLSFSELEFTMIKGKFDHMIDFNHTASHINAPSRGQQMYWVVRPFRFQV